MSETKVNRYEPDSTKQTGLRECAGGLVVLASDYDRILRDDTLARGMNTLLYAEIAALEAERKLLEAVVEAGQVVVNEMVDIGPHGPDLVAALCAYRASKEKGHE